VKNLLISIFAISLAAALPTVVLAQDEHHDQSAPHGSTGGAPSSDRGTTGGTVRTDRRTTPMDTHTTPMMTHHTYRHRTVRPVVDHTTVHVDVSSFHKNIDAPNHFHYGNYNPPRGYVYRRWSSGDRLPQGYWAQQYWINNFFNFGLLAPPDGYVWVRYGPDAVLIDENTGEIIEVEYGLFY
jgi:Ni/Co efflux regulator RcnB